MFEKTALKIANRIIRISESREPDFVIGQPEDPYLNRWYLIPRNRFFNAYLHQFLRSDDDRALHDHPWASLSLILKGGYREILPYRLRVGPSMRNLLRVGPVKKPGSAILRLPSSAHRIELLRDRRSGIEEQCWTLFLTGPKVREWGFWCVQGWRHWREYVSSSEDSKGNHIGKGCD